MLAPPAALQAHLRRNSAALAVLLLGLLATAVAWRYVSGVVRAANETRLERESNLVMQGLTEHIDAYLMTLRAARGLFADGRVPSRTQFRGLVESVGVSAHYPGIQGVGFARLVPAADLTAHEAEVRASGYPEYAVWPRGARDPYSSIVYLEPFDWRNRRAFGYDMLSEPTRRSAMERARDSGEPTASGRVELVQEEGAVRQPGFLIYLAVYRGDPRTPAERQAALVGWVYAPFRSTDLLRGALAGRLPRALDFEVYDGSEPKAADLLFATHGSQPLGPERVSRSVLLPIAGKDLAIRFAMLPDFQPDWQRWFPREVALAGVVLSLLLFLITRTQVRARTVAERAEWRAELLAEAGKLFASSLDYAPQLQGLARLLADHLGDWCAVDLREPGGPVRAVARRGMGEPPEPFPLSLEVSWGPSAVLRTATPVLLTGVGSPGPPQPGAAWKVPGESLRDLRAAGVQSALCVPLLVRFEPIGALTVLSTDPWRRLGHDELAVAEELAALAAAAVDGARLYRQATDAVQARDEFLSIAAHELRTPITALVLQAEGLEHGLLTMDLLRRRAQAMTRSLGRLTKLVDNLLDISRITAGRLHLELQEVDLVAVARDVAARLSPEAAQASCAVEVRAEGQVIGLWDRLRLEQIVTNLLANAVKYGGGRPVAIEVGTLSPQARLVVRDRGVGIPLQDQRRIFERFERAVSGQAVGGLGLGLWIVRQIVEALGGTIGVESEPGKGSTFTVLLPRGPARE